MKWCDCHYDLTNKNIGFLHVNHLVSATWNRRDQRIWNCTCICGNTIEIKEQALLKGESQTKSCGCINKRTYLINKVFGKLKVVEYLGKHKGSQYWRCQCECGKDDVYKTTTQLNKNKLLACDECIHNVQYILKDDDYYECHIKNKNIIFYIDKEDYIKTVKYNWCMSDNGYIKSSNLYLHRFIMCENENHENIVDHINHNKLDNRKRNLRLATYSQNGMNSICQIKEMVGVKQTGKGSWQSFIYINNDRIYLGSFDSLEKAKEARKKAEDEYFKEYSYKNSMLLGEKYEI